MSVYVAGDVVVLDELPVTGPAGLPLVAPLPAEHLTLDADPTLLHDELRGLIEQAIIGHPRSQQTTIGPSEVGTPCTRRLAWKLGGVPPVQVERAAWRPTVGTAVHTWLAEVLIADNERRVARGEPARWLVELRVAPGLIGDDDLTGSLDVYDRVTGDIVDWKIVGAASLKAARKDGPKQAYRVQVHLYGAGVRRRGLPVRNVHVIFLPSAGELSEAVMWSQPWSEQVAQAALDRASAVHRAGLALGHLQVGALADTADDFCGYCPWLAATRTDPAAGRCPGSTAYQAARGQRATTPTGDPFT